MSELKEIDNCCTDMKTLLALDSRAEKDLKNNTHNIGQEEILTIIREFIRCKNDYKSLKDKYKFTGRIVRNKIDGKIGIVMRVNENGSIQVLEKIEPKVINTHNSFETLEFLEEGE